MKPKSIEKYNRWSVAFYPSLGHNTSIDSKSEPRDGRREHLSGLSARKNVCGSWLLFAFRVEQPNNPTVVMVFPRGYPKRMSWKREDCNSQWLPETRLEETIMTTIGEINRFWWTNEKNPTDVMVIPKNHVISRVIFWSQTIEKPNRNSERDY